MKEQGIQLGFSELWQADVEGLHTKVKKPRLKQMVAAHMRIIEHMEITQGANNPILASFDWDTVNTPLVAQEIYALRLACEKVKLPVTWEHVTQHLDSDSGRTTIVDTLVARRVTPETRVPREPTPLRHSRLRRAS